MFTRFITTTVATAALITTTLASPTTAQTPLTSDGAYHVISPTGSYQDFTIPIGPEALQLTAAGGKGGDGQDGANCIGYGGAGAERR